jgi:hypothetical protein
MEKTKLDVILTTKMKKIDINDSTNIIVDDEDYLKVLFYDWKLIRTNVGKNYIYAYTTVFNENKKREKLFLHHLIFGRPSNDKVFWFKDGNRLNCQRSNVEIISKSEKGHLVYKQQKNGNKIKRGVITNYIARVKVDGKIKVIGVYKSKEEAANAYNNEVKKLYGDLAVLNDL